MAGSRKTEYEIALLVGGQVQASFGNSINSVNDGFEKMTSMASTAAKMVTAAFGAVKIGQFVTDAVQTYSEFEQSMANTAATANATQAQYEQLEAAARSMGKATTKTASEAADALGYMMLAGWDVNETITGLEPVLRLSEATQMDLATCSDLVTDSMSALGLSVDGLGGYLDICTMANNSANTSAEALMEAFIGCGGTARTAGADLTDTATALGILANNGTKGAEAGTALNSMLVRMTSKKAAINAMKDLGVAVFNDAGEFRGLQTVLVDVQQALSGLTAEQQASYMASIAGTNYYTEMSYLLAAVANNAEDSASYLQAAGLEGEELEAALVAAASDSMSAWDELSASLNDSDGALMNMANTVTDTLSGAFARLDSAADDAKISFADAFSDDLKHAVNGLAEEIPVLTDKFIEFASKAGPKISGAFQVVTKGAGQALDVVSGMGGWVIDNFDTVEKVIAGVGGAIITYKVVSGLTGVAGAIKGVGTALKAMTVTNPWLLGLTLAASAVIGIAAAIKTAEKQAVKSNLAAHFGDIALSMEDISQVAAHIIRSDSLSRIQDSLAAFGELDSIQSNMQDSINAINKMNWKVSIGMELSKDEQDSYISEIQSYVSSAQEYVQQEQYALNLNLAPFAEGDLERQNIVDKLNSFYSDKYTELEGIGIRLNETVTEAFRDELLDMDEAKEITELQSQMARIQESMATSDFDAKLKVMELQYAAGDLDAEGFQALQEELAVQTEAAAAKYEESLRMRIAKSDVAFKDGALSQEEYDAAVNEYWEDYLTAVTEMEFKALNFQTNTIMQQYSEELGPAIDSYWENVGDVMDKYSGEGMEFEWNERSWSMWDGMRQALTDNELDKDTQGAIEILMDSMRPSIERAETLKQQWEDLGKVMPQWILDGLSDAETLNALTEDSDSIYYTLGQAMEGSEYYEEIISKLNENGRYVPETLTEGIESRMEEAIAPVIDGMYAYTDASILKTFANGFDVSADVNIKLNPVYSQTQPSPSWSSFSIGRQSTANTKLFGHAEGGIFDKPHVAWFAEDGPEAAIPLDGSNNAVSLWEKVGQLLGIFDGGMTKSRGEELYSGIVSGQAADSTAAETTDARQFIFSPQIQIEGNANREEVMDVMHFSMEQFREYMEEYLAEMGRVSLHR